MTLAPGDSPANVKRANPYAGKLVGCTTVKNYKVAALFFDHIITCFPEDDSDPIPEGIAIVLIPDTTSSAIRDFLILSKKAPLPDIQPHIETWISQVEKLTVRFVAERVADAGLPIVPYYGSEGDFSANFQGGEVDAYKAVLNNVSLVSSDLTWDSVAEFRKDSDSVRKYRALRLWLRDSLKEATSVQHATDIIGNKLSEYEWAVEKHGLNTVQGFITDVLNSKDFLAASVATGVATLAGAPAWAMLGGAGAVIGRVAASVRKCRIDRIDIARQNTPIALIHEVKQLVGD